MKNLLLIALLFVQTLWTVNAQHYIKGNGHIVTKERTIEGFNTIKVSGSFNVHLSPELKKKLTLTTDENIIEAIVTEVKEGVLIIRSKKGRNLRPSDRNRIQITIPQASLKGPFLSGSGKIYSDNTFTTGQFKSHLSGSGKIDLQLKADHIETVLSGSGKIVLTGHTNRLKVKLSGSGVIRLNDLEAQQGEISLSGSGNAYVHCRDELKAVVSGSGRIRYYGEPKEKLHTKVNGSGSIRKAIE